MFVRYGDGVSGLFVMNADGSDVRQVADPGTDILGPPAWSPDGASIAMAFNGVDGGAPGGIVLIPADGLAGEPWSLGPRSSTQTT